MSDKVKAAWIVAIGGIVVALIYVLSPKILSISIGSPTTVEPSGPSNSFSSQQQSQNNPPQSNNFTIDRGGSLTTSSGTIICTGDIVGPNFSPDSDPDTGEIVVSQHAGVVLQFPYGGSCTRWATNLEGSDLTNEVQSIKSSQKCRDGVQPCRSITEYDV